MKRLATALVLIPVLTWVVLAAPDWVFVAVLAAIGLAAFHEYDQIAPLRSGWPGMIAGLILLLAPAPWMVVVLAALAAMTLALRGRDVASVMPGAGIFLLGVVYIFGSWRCAIELRTINHHWLMFALIINWAGDTAALYIGRAFGRHKMAPRVSPAKSWEGSIASVAGGLLVGAIYAYYLLPSVPLTVVLPLGAAGNIAGQIGDLCESALKRGAGVKDSGTWLPGHGGWLDRIDSSLFSVPVVYALLQFAILR
jgi:phosphatidate cytidylyltransferase